MKGHGACGFHAFIICAGYKQRLIKEYVGNGPFTLICCDAVGGINIGFMVMEPEIFNYIEGDSISFEKEPMAALVERKQLAAYTHKGFWQCMDTVREKERLEKLWESGQAPWKIWED